MPLKVNDGNKGAWARPQGRKSLGAQERNQVGARGILRVGFWVSFPALWFEDHLLVCVSHPSLGLQKGRG